MTGRKSILIVDDTKVDRALISKLFKNEYALIEATNGKEALESIYQNIDSLVMVLLDLIMPVMNGFELLRYMRESKLLERIPVVMITSEDSQESEVKALMLGASDIIRKPFNAYVVKQRVCNILDLYSHKTELESIVKRQMKKLSATNDYLVDSLSTVIECRSMESGLHIRRIRSFTNVLLHALSEDINQYGLNPRMITTITSASSMHDIGKISIPDSILLKPGRLTSDEFEVMKQHTVKGCDILNQFRHINDKQYLKFCYDICKYHHERWDGNGYPEGLKGDRIPLCAQVVAIADVYDALTTNRVYKPAYTHEKAVQMIINGECGVFSTNMLRAFLKVSSKFERLSIGFSTNDKFYNSMKDNLEEEEKSDY